MYMYLGNGSSNLYHHNFQLRAAINCVYKRRCMYFMEQDNVMQQYVMQHFCREREERGTL